MAGRELPKELQGRGAPEFYFKTPYELIDRLPEFTSLAEMKVFLYVLRHTYGYKEWNNLKHITLDEFCNGRKGKFGKRLDKGVGMTKANVMKGIKLAVAHHVLYEIKDDSDAARKERYYAVAFWPTDEPEASNQYIKTTDEQENDETEVSNQYHSGANSIPGDVSNQYPGGAETIQRSEIDTPERDFKKDTKKYKLGAPKVAPPVSLSKSKREEHEDEPTSADVATPEADTSSELSATLEGEGCLPAKEEVAARAESREQQKAEQERRWKAQKIRDAICYELVREELRIKRDMKRAPADSPEAEELKRRYENVTAEQHWWHTEGGQ